MTAFPALSILAIWPDVAYSRAWKQDGVFEQVRITELGALEWPGELDLCADALYLKLTGKQPEDIFSALRKHVTHA